MDDVEEVTPPRLSRGSIRRRDDIDDDSNSESGREDGRIDNPVHAGERNDVHAIDR